MRILMVLGTSAGGVGRHVYELTAGLARRGHEVLVAAPAQAQDHFGFSGVAAGVTAVPIGDRTRPGEVARALAGLRAATRGADVVHAHGVRAAALTGVAKPRAVPLVATLHNAAPQGRAAGPYRVLERIVTRRASAVTAVSADLLDAMIVLGARNPSLAVVPAPAPPLLSRPRGQTREDLGLGSGERLALCVGRLAPQKGLEFLLDAAALLDGPIRIAIAGDGPLRAALAERIAAENLPVDLLGHRDDAPDLMAAADLVVSSARWEGQPVGLQEALLQGSAVVATDVGGTAAVLGGAGILVPYGDTHELADAIARVCNDTALRSRLCRQALDRARELPTREDAVDDAERVYALADATTRAD